MQISGSLKVAVVLALLGAGFVCFSAYSVHRSALLEVRLSDGSVLCSADIASTPTERGHIKENVDSLSTSACFFLIYASERTQEVDWLHPIKNRLAFLDRHFEVVDPSTAYQSVLVLPDGTRVPPVGTTVRMMGPVPQAIDVSESTPEHHWGQKNKQ